VGDVQRGQPSDVPRHESFVRHPIRATAHEAVHVREIAEQGESPATPAIVAGGVLAVVVPLAAIIIFLALGIARFA
jgi:hypothetical protein